MIKWDDFRGFWDNFGDFGTISRTLGRFGCFSGHRRNFLGHLVWDGTGILGRVMDSVGH